MSALPADAAHLPDARLARRVNTELCDLVSSGRQEPLPFFCECGAAGCFTPVWLTPREFGQLAGAGFTVLAPDHEPATPPRHARRRGGVARRAPSRVKERA